MFKKYAMLIYKMFSFKVKLKCETEYNYYLDHTGEVDLLISFMLFPFIPQYSNYILLTFYF